MRRPKAKLSIGGWSDSSSFNYIRGSSVKSNSVGGNLINSKSNRGSLVILKVLGRNLVCVLYVNNTLNFCRT